MSNQSLISAFNAVRKVVGAQSELETDLMVAVEQAHANGGATGNVQWFLNAMSIQALDGRNVIRDFFKRTNFKINYANDSETFVNAAGHKCAKDDKGAVIMKEWIKQQMADCDGDNDDEAHVRALIGQVDRSVLYTVVKAKKRDAEKANKLQDYLDREEFVTKFIAGEQIDLTNEFKIQAVVSGVEQVDGEGKPVYSPIIITGYQSSISEFMRQVEYEVRRAKRENKAEAKSDTELAKEALTRALNALSKVNFEKLPANTMTEGEFNVIKKLIEKNTVRAAAFSQFINALETRAAQPVLNQGE